MSLCSICLGRLADQGGLHARTIDLQQHLEGANNIPVCFVWARINGRCQLGVVVVGGAVVKHLAALKRWLMENLLLYLVFFFNEM
jgi:hypothetical protein